MNLQQFSQGDALTQLVVRSMMERSAVLALVQFYSMVGNADYARKVATASGGGYRALGDEYADNKQDPVFANPTLTIYGDKVQVDRAHERRGSDIASVRASMLIKFAQNLGKNFNYQLINGDPGVDAKQISGVKTMLTASHKVLGVPTNGLVVNLGNTDAAVTARQHFLELIDELIELAEGATALIMDIKSISRLSTIAKDQCTTIVNDFGVPIKHYNHIPLIPAGANVAGTKTITHAETRGTNSATTSIYAAKFGEETDLTFAGNIGVEVVDHGLIGNHWEHSLDFDIASALLNDKAIAVLQGIEISN